MSDLVHLKIRDDPAIPDALSWYLDVVENRRPAKFRIAATVVTQIDPVASNEETLDGGGAIDPIEPAAPFHAISLRFFADLRLGGNSFELW
ncbi:MAG TPA: hypothetical protein VFK01_07980 [Bradyrhizobium sp.]|nr:hypothetical protein [Bradyrhizobium sp.]